MTEKELRGDQRENSAAGSKTERLEKRKEELAKLFDRQMKTLKSRGCPQAILRVFLAQRDTVISKAAEMKIPEGHIPFVPVIPRAYLGISKLISMVYHKNKKGYTYLYLNEITDRIEIQKEPYFIYDVEDGKVTLGMSPKEAERFIKKQWRSCLTIDEGIAVCVHTNVLFRHYIDCLGSRHKNLDKVPSIYIFDGEPRLDLSNFDATSNDKWGFPSCAIRI